MGHLPQIALLSLLSSCGGGGDQPPAHQSPATTTTTLPSPQTGPSIAAVHAVIQKRCLLCHAEGGAPAGIQLQTEALLRAHASIVFDVVVTHRSMPQGNVTGMTQEERDLIAAWYRSGAN